MFLPNCDWSHLCTCVSPIAVAYRSGVQLQLPRPTPNSNSVEYAADVEVREGKVELDELDGMWLRDAGARCRMPGQYREGFAAGPQGPKVPELEEALKLYIG